MVEIGRDVVQRVLRLIGVEVLGERAQRRAELLTAAALEALRETLVGSSPPGA